MMLLLHADLAHALLDENARDAMMIGRHVENLATNT